MSKKAKLLQKILTGSLENISFNDFITAITQAGFIHDRTTGSHQIWIHPQSLYRLNLQPKADKTAKNYQIKEFREYINSQKP